MNQEDKVEIYVSLIAKSFFIKFIFIAVTVTYLSREPEKHMFCKASSISRIQISGCLQKIIEIWDLTVLEWQFEMISFALYNLPLYINQSLRYSPKHCSASHSQTHLSRQRKTLLKRTANADTLYFVHCQNGNQPV